MSDDRLTKHSPAGLAAPDCEIKDGFVVCPACGEENPASEMKMSMDAISSNSTGAVIEITRRYVCSEECSAHTMFGGL